MKASIIGAGTWGTALGILLAHNGHKVTIWSKFQQEVDALQETHRHKNLPGAVIPESMCFSSEREAALKDQELVVLAVPSIFVRATAHEMKPYVGEGQVIVSVAKGIEEGTLYTMSDIIEEEIPQADVAVLSGPSHAEEVSRFIPTTIVTGAHTEKTALFVQCLHQPGYQGHRDRRRDEERHRAGGRYGGRSRLWRQHEGGADHTRYRGDRAARREDGLPHGDLQRPERYR